MNEGGGSQRRVSFLMPYIDFCFMLIIIFVSMVSIAYFEPIGVSDFRTKKEQPLENTMGQFETRPSGIETNNAGLGVAGTETKPLTAPGTNVGRSKQMLACPPIIPARAVIAKPQPKPQPVVKAPVTTPGPIAVPIGAQGRGPGDIPKEDYEKLKKLYEDQLKELEALRARLVEQKTGVSDHLYLDLRNNK